MQIRVIDLQGFEKNVDVEQGITLKDFLQLISQDYQYDITNCAVYHFGALLHLDDKITQELLNNDNFLVLVNKNIYKPKSYSSVDYSYHFQSSRFKEYFSESKNVDSLCPRLNQTDKNIRNDDVNYENSFYNKLQIKIDPNFAILPTNEKQTKNDNIDLTKNPQNFHRILSRYNPDERDSLRRLVHIFPQISIVVQVFENCQRNEAEAEAVLQSINA